MRTWKAGDALPSRDAQNTAASPFFECRLENLLRPFRLLTLSSSPSRFGSGCSRVLRRRCRCVMGTLTPSICSGTPSVLAGLEMALDRSLRPESPEYEFVRDCERAKSRACSMLSSHSAVLNLLPSGSEVVALGSSKIRCLSLCDWREQA